MDKMIAADLTRAGIDAESWISPVGAPGARVIDEPSAG